MATVTILRGTATAITITLDSLASSPTAGRESTAVDDTSTKALDYLVTTKLVFPNSAPANDKTVYVYVCGYDGTNWTGGIAGSGNAAFTFDDITTTPFPGRLLGAAFMVQNKTRQYGPWSVAACFGGVVPIKWALAVVNYSGQTLASGCTATYQAITATVA